MVPVWWLRLTYRVHFAKKKVSIIRLPSPHDNAVLVSHVGYAYGDKVTQHRSDALAHGYNTEIIRMLLSSIQVGDYNVNTR